MNRVFVLGNGISRRQVNLNHLQAYGPVYGCNALYREFTPAVLVATDRPIATQIQESGYSAKNTFYTRKPLDKLGAQRIPHDYHGCSSGPAAVGIAAHNGARNVYLLGFDLGGTQDHRFNNVYADTEFYKTSDAKPTFSGNWVRQLCKIIKNHPKIKFVRVVGNTTAAVLEFDSFANFSRCDLRWFQDCINNQKDL